MVSGGRVGNGGQYRARCRRRSAQVAKIAGGGGGGREATRRLREGGERGDSSAGPPPGREGHTGRLVGGVAVTARPVLHR